MSVVEKAIEAGRCAVAVGAAQLRDPEVMLALRERAALVPMALSGPAQSPVVPVGEAALARLAQPGSVLILCEPELADAPGVEATMRILEKLHAKPTIIAVSRQWNPFQFPQLGRAKVEHEKGRTKPFLQAMAKPPAVDPGAQAPADDAAPKAPRAQKVVPGEPAAPRFHFVGREEDMDALRPMLESGGPIVVSGPPGVGRSWLVEHAVVASGLTRLPDFVLGYGSGFDSLIARLAEVCKAGGSDLLSITLAAEDRTPMKLVDAAIHALAAASGAEGQVMVIRHLEFGLGREPDFFRRSRLELLLERILCATFPLRIVFVSTRQPHFHREGRATSLRRHAVQGIKGRFYNEIFAAYKAPDFPRDRFGAIAEKLHGSPVAIRAYAIAVRDRPDGVALTEDPKFLRMESASDLEPVGKQIAKKLERLQPDERRALSRLAHCRLPVTGNIMSDMAISRKTRLELLADGLLEMIGTENDKRYRVHELVRDHLPYREVQDFDVYAGLAEMYGKAARAATDPVERLAFAQEANRCAYGARNPRLTLKLDAPDNDGILEAGVVQMRGDKARLDVAGQRFADVIAKDATNSDAWLLQLELMDRTDGKPDKISEALEEAITKAPVPELFQWGTGFWLGRKQRPRAIGLLERAIEVEPDESRLRTRLASLLIRQGRRPEGIAQLEKAMELDPMLPDSYGLLGMARRDEGAASLPRAEELLREAVRLASDDPTQVGRLADLLLARARVATPEEATRLRAEVKELLDPMIKGDRKAPEAHLLLATLVREETGDLERAAWLLKRARKLSERHAVDRNNRITLEEAIIESLRGNHDAAETAARDVAKREMSNARAFAVLGQIMAHRESYVAAHAEFLRARERATPGSLEAEEYQAAIAQMQTMIELQATRLYAGEDVDELPSGPTQGPSRVIRRARADGAATEGAEQAEGTNAPDQVDGANAPGPGLDADTLAAEESGLTTPVVAEVHDASAEEPTERMETDGQGSETPASES